MKMKETIDEWMNDDNKEKERKTRNSLNEIIWYKQHRYYLPTPPLGQDKTQGQFLSGV